MTCTDEGLLHRREPSNCCGLLPNQSKTTRAIPFHSILWAELSSFDVTIHYALPTGKRRCRVSYINYNITDKSLHSHATRWIVRLLERAYPRGTQRRRRIKVLINPFGGQGYAQKLWTREIEPIFAAARCDIDVEKTAYKGHAIEIAEKLDVEAYDVVACCSGDGLPHEVFNGLAKRKDARRALSKIAVIQLPCGTGNAMSLNLNGSDSPSLAALASVKGVRTPLDLVAITQGSNKYYSFLSQSVGIVAESDLGTESLRWMGSARFTWGFLVRLMGKTVYPAEVAVAVEESDKRRIREMYRQAIDEQQAAADKLASHSDDEEEYRHADSQLEIPPLRYGTIFDPLHPAFEKMDLPTLGNFYTGNMCFMSPDAPFFTTALPSDGQMDMVQIDGTIPRLTALRMLTSVEHGALINFSEVSYRKVSGYRITPRLREPSAKRKYRKKIGGWLGGGGGQRDGYISIDGERVPFEAFQAEVVPGLGTVLSKRGPIYEYEGARSP